MRLIGLAVVLALVVALALSTDEAQPPGKVWRIGMLEATPPALNAAYLEAFRQGLRELGYVEGQNFVIEYRSADGRPERVPELATGLVRLKGDLIVTRGTPATLAAKQATGSIPIVMASSGDPLGLGIVSSLAHPGGNVTGLTTFTVELGGKRVELLKEAIPRIARIAQLANTSNPASATQWRQIDPPTNVLAAVGNENRANSSADTGTFSYSVAGTVSTSFPYPHHPGERRLGRDHEHGRLPELLQLTGESGHPRIRRGA